MRKSIEKNGNCTRYTYDYLKRPIIKSLFSPAGELLSEIKATYNTFHLLSECDAAGKRTHYRYDSAGRLLETKRGNKRTTFAYDGCGRCSKTIEWDGDECGIVKLQEYDLKGRVIGERKQDLRGNHISQTSCGYGIDGQLIYTSTHTDEGKTTTYTSYDSRRKPIKMSDASGRETHMIHRYDFRNAHGQLVPYSETTDAAGCTAITILDSVGRVSMTQVKDSFGDLLQQKEYFYDGNGNKVREIEALINEGKVSSRGMITDWAYDSMNRLISKHEGVGRNKERITQMTYTKSGQKKNVTTNNGIELNHSYDLKGRLKSYSASDGSFSYHYTYDLCDNLLSVRNSRDGSESFYKYDSNDRMVSETLANGLKISHRYNGLDLPTEIKLPDQTRIAYRYDGIKLIEIQRLTPEKSMVYKHTYDSYDLSGKVLSITLIGNAGLASFSYDAIGRLHESICGAWRERLRYSKTGDVVKKKRCDPLSRQCCIYNYDELHQLIQEDSTTSQTYTYDSRHNRRTKNEEKYQLNGVNELLSDGECEYAYDGNGNVIKSLKEGKLTRYSYDALDRLTTVIKDDIEYVYTYDAQNRRMSKQAFISIDSKWIPQAKVRYLYNGQNEIGAFDDEGRALELRISGLGKGAEIGSAVALELQGKVYAPVHDASGNLSGLIDARTGDPVETYRYSAFGEHELYDAQGNVIETPLSPWLFSSKRLDPETGLVYFGCRYYHPKTGRWITPDPLGGEGGPNLYAFVVNSPLNYIDHYGLLPFSFTGIGTWISDKCQEFVSRNGFEMPDWSHPVTPWADTELNTVGTPTYILPKPGHENVQFFDSWEKKYFGLSSQYAPNSSSAFSLQSARYWSNERRAVFANGVNNTFMECYHSVEYISLLAKGASMRGIHNATFNPLWDGVECGLGLVGGIATDPVRLLHREWDAMFEVGSPSARILQICHSQGAIHVANALLTYCPEKRKRIEVLAIAPGGYIDPKTCGKVTHYRAEAHRDMIPRIDYFGYCRARETVVTLKSHKDAPIHDHAFTSPTYKEVIKKTVLAFMGKN